MAQSAKPLGELLVQKKLISPAQLQMALEEQRSTKEFLGRLLVRKGWLNHEDLLKTLAEQMGLPFVQLQLDQVDWSLVKRFSQTAIVEHKTLPITMDRSSITVAMVNPLDVWGLEAIEKEAAGRTIRQVLISEEDFQLAMTHFKQLNSASRPASGGVNVQ